MCVFRVCGEHHEILSDIVVKIPRPHGYLWQLVSRPKLFKKWMCTNAIYCTLRAWTLHNMRILKCILLVCALTVAFLKVSMRVYGVCMEHFACHLGHFTPLRHTLQSICTNSIFHNFGLLCVQYIAPWDSGNSATMSFKNLHVYHGETYRSHRISTYNAHRRSIYIYI